MNKVLRRGDRLAEVKELQERLNAVLKPSPKLTADGDFGLKTLAAVNLFQAEKNLGIDGVVGPKTWQLLQNIKDGKKISSPKAAVVIGSAGDWIRIAKRELGQSEVVGKVHNPRIIQYHASTTLKAKSDEVSWCSAFVNWVITESKRVGTNSASASSWLNWGVNTTAKAGAIAVIRNGKAANTSLTRSGSHVGFLVKETATHYFLLGGNQSNQVKVSSFPKSSWTLRGYRWPKE